MNIKRTNYNEVGNDDYIKMYKFLFEEEFNDMSNDAKVLYCILIDRINKAIAESNKNIYGIDNEGGIFLKPITEDMKKIMNRSTQKIIKLKKELESFNLIENIRIGNGKPNKIYVLIRVIEY
jgi:hypothetical protein